MQNMQRGAGLHTANNHNLDSLELDLHLHKPVSENEAENT